MILSEQQRRISAPALVGLHIPIAALLVDPVADQVLRAIELLRPGVACDEAGRLPHHVELAVGAHFADQDRLGDVVVRQHLGHAASQIRHLDAGQRVDHLVGIGRLGLLDRLHPHGEADHVGFHRVVGDSLVALLESLPLGDEVLVRRRVDRLEVVPRGKVAEQRLGVDAGEFFFTHRERDRRDVLRLDALVAELLVKRDVGVAVDRGHDRGLLARRAELLDVGHDGLPVGMAERRVVDHDVFLLHALRLEVRLKDLVGRARIDVVGAGQDPALHLLFLLEIIDRRDRLLVRGGAGVEHVALALLALVLHRIEQDRVQLLEHREHRLARHRGPAAEHGRDLFLGDQLARLFGEQRPVGGRIDDHRFELLAEQAAFLVLLVDQENIVSFSVVSLMAMVPESECRIPTLMVSWAMGRQYGEAEG